MALPGPIPSQMASLWAAASRAASEVGFAQGRRGRYIRLSVVGRDGQERFTSRIYPMSQVEPVEFRFFTPRADIRGWRVKLYTYIVSFSNPTVVLSRGVAFKTITRTPTSGFVKILVPVQNIRQVVGSPNDARVRLSPYPRVRRKATPRQNRPSPETKIAYGTRWRDANGVVSFLGNQNYICYSRTWTGDRTPGFGRLRKRQLPVNPHYVYRWEQSDSGWYEETVDKRTSAGYYQRDCSPYMYVIGGVHTGASPSQVNHLTELDNIALRRLAERASLGIKANLAQDLLQISQTASTIADTANRIATAITQLRKRNVDGAVKALWRSGTPRFAYNRIPSGSSNLANNWLALQYGWKPLLQDVYGSMEALADFFSKSDQVIWKFGASAKKEKVDTQKLRYSGVITPPCGLRTETIAGRVAYGIEFTIDSRLKVFLSQTGFLNPINLMWEVLPFSFVVDWYLPIGPYLEALSAYQGLSFVRGYKTQFTKSETTYSHSYNGQHPGYTDKRVTLYSVGGLVHSQLKLTRTKLTSFPQPNLPRLKSPVSLIHALNGWALLTQVFANAEEKSTGNQPRRVRK